MYETILVATDGSAAAGRAADLAIDLAETFDATLHVIHVAENGVSGGDDASVDGQIPGVDDRETIAVQASATVDAVRVVADQARAAGVAVETAVLEGRPFQEILRYARSTDADLVLVGSVGEDNSEPLGRVADRVGRSAQRPVITV